VNLIPDDLGTSVVDHIHHSPWDSLKEKRQKIYHAKTYSLTNQRDLIFIGSAKIFRSFEDRIYPFATGLIG
jgi:hypothetical protein